LGRLSDRGGDGCERRVAHGLVAAVTPLRIQVDLPAQHIGVADMMDSRDFHTGIDDVLAGAGWPGWYDAAPPPVQNRYEWGRMFAAALGAQANAVYDADGKARGRAEGAFLRLIHDLSILS
jgi:hypothetical protein